jgi:hypothetical protein
MEDFYDIKSSRIADKQISLFGIFDGWRFVLVTYFCCPVHQSIDLLIF